MRIIIIFYAVFCLYSIQSFCQVPTTDIYLLDMNARHGKFQFSNAQKISEWKGYNNQPYFTPDSKSIYYVSYRNKQSDIYKYDIATKATTQFTNTPEDEYSPKLSPDGKYISAVRVMKDSSQQLWEFPVNGGDPKQLLKGHDSIGYYIWMDNKIVTANVPEPMKLELTDTTHGSANLVVIKNVGRTLQAIKNKLILFVQKPTDKKDSVSWICAMYKEQTIMLIALMPNCEDFALGPMNTLFMGKNGKLYKYRLGKDKEWIEIADFANTEYKNFYRIVINKKGDKIALVSYQGNKP